ncbi:DUF2189 domain-containing protein [Marinovum sp.]|uniref:DUF2189 domain-containing protein n=1 Tax=Marinovum sp. TaxID=2024839 RepID=UPI003A905365
MTETSQIGAPPLAAATPQMLRQALHKGWRDFTRAPALSLAFAGVYVLLGWLMAGITWATGQSYWLVFAAVGFPLIGPFAAIGFYEISRRLQAGAALEAGAVMSVIFRQRNRQLPSLCAVIVILFLFWFFLAHMIFALFLGRATMTHVSTSFEVYRSLEGLTMLAVGTGVGAGFALLIFNITVISLPMLLDREIDFVSAMIASFQAVTRAPLVLLAWAGLIAVLTFLAMLPGFLGLFVVLPLLGHATWHLYDQMKTTAPELRGEPARA